jgi:uncharacterized protein (TIGR02271 family)
MQSTKTTVVGLFENESTARQVINALTEAGIDRNDIHLSSQNDYSDVASGGAGLSGTSQTEHHTGGFLGWLSSVFGDDANADEHTNRYDQAARSGGYVVAVRTDDRMVDRAADILNEHGAVDVDQNVATQGYETTGTQSRPAKPVMNDARSAVKEGGETIPVVNEELQVGKRTIQRGGVRVFSRITEQPVSEEVRLREEKVNVERRQVDRPVTEADQTAMRDQTIEVTEMAEEPVISKRARVVEEVRVGKDVRETTQTVRDTVRRTEVNTERIGGESGATSYADDFRRDFESRYASSGATYDTYAPAYDYGSRVASDPRYEGTSWTDVESTLKTDYLRNNPNSQWDNVKGAVRYGWEKVTGQR